MFHAEDADLCLKIKVNFCILSVTKSSICHNFFYNLFHLSFIDSGIIRYFRILETRKCNFNALK